MGMIESIFTKDRLTNGNRRPKPRRKMGPRRDEVIGNFMKRIFDAKNEIGKKSG